MVKVILIAIAFLMLLPGTKEDLLTQGFRVFKELAVGLPTQIIANQLTILCPGLRDLGKLFDWLTFSSEPIYFQLRGPKKTSWVRVSKANTLIDLPDFKANHSTVIIIGGWLSGSGYMLVSDDITKAYRKRKDVNIVELYTARYIDTRYTKSADNTKRLGAEVAIGLIALSRVYDINRVHLIGFSLGAQIAGAAGRDFKRKTNGRLLQRITGLDPANPCFYQWRLPGLSKSDAHFVDVIHTNPGALGTTRAVAHADFFVGGFNSIQSNCLEIICSHLRAGEYYAESVEPGNEYNFAASWCKSTIDVPGRQCQGPNAFMGYMASKTARGIYYLEVNMGKPFGKNSCRQRIGTSLNKNEKSNGTNSSQEGTGNGLNKDGMSNGTSSSQEGTGNGLNKDEMSNGTNSFQKNSGNSSN